MSPSPSSASSSGDASNTPAPHDASAANPGWHVPIESSAQAAEEEKEEHPLNEFSNVGKSPSSDHPKLQPFRTPLELDSHGAATSSSTTGRSWFSFLFSTSNIRRSYQTIGVIYGDIGTSPLYTLTAIFTPSSSDTLLTLDASNTTDLLGILSLLFWSLTMVVCLKYVCIVLVADDKGEGGSLALLGLLRRSQSAAPPSSRQWLLRDSLRPLTLLAMFAACLLIGDGVITPAISVLSAIEGIAVHNSSLQPAVVPITLLVLVVLFLCQRFGTARMAGLFSPIMLLWFVSLLLLGLYNLSTAPSAATLVVLGSISPHHVVLFFYNHGLQSISHMAAVVLCITGVEAMFADMGHFDRRSIRCSWLLVVYPALTIHYLGQGVALLQNPSISANVFYGSIPVQDGALFWAMVLLSTCATLIASQALISGAFSITAAAVRLHFAPLLPILHTSTTASGHIYIPAVNYLLMLCTCACVLAFETSANLANAYGVAVCCDMVLTSTFLCFVIRLVWHRSYVLLACYVLVFMSIDVTFLLGNLAKIEAGGWLPLSFSLLLTACLYVWEWGERRLVEERHLQPSPEQQWDSVLASKTRVNQDQADSRWSVFFVQPDEEDGLEEGEEESDAVGTETALQEVEVTVASLPPLPPLPLCAWQMGSRLHALPSRCVFVKIHTTSQSPFVSPTARWEWCSDQHEALAEAGLRVRQLTLRYGFMDKVDELVADDIAAALDQSVDQTSTPLSPLDFFLGSVEMVCDPPAGSSWTPLRDASSIRRMRYAVARFAHWVSTLSSYWLMTGFNILSRGTCHGDTYKLPASRVIKLTSKLNLTAAVDDDGDEDEDEDGEEEEQEEEGDGDNHSPLGNSEDLEEKQTEAANKALI